MLYREIIAVCSQIHTKHINTVCGQNVELLNVKLVVHQITIKHQNVNAVHGTNRQTMRQAGAIQITPVAIKICLHSLFKNQFTVSTDECEVFATLLSYIFVRSESEMCFRSVAYPGILFGGGGC